MTSNWRKGWEREDEIRKALQNDGWTVERSPFSLGTYDLRADKEISLPINIPFPYDDKAPEVKVKIRLLIQAKYRAEQMSLKDRMLLVSSAREMSSILEPDIAVIAMEGSRKQPPNKKVKRLLLKQLDYQIYPIQAVKAYIEEFNIRKTRTRKSSS